MAMFRASRSSAAQIRGPDRAPAERGAIVMASRQSGSTTSRIDAASPQDCGARIPCLSLFSDRCDPPDGWALVSSSRTAAPTSTSAFPLADYFVSGPVAAGGENSRCTAASVSCTSRLPGRRSRLCRYMSSAPCIIIGAATTCCGACCRGPGLRDRSRDAHCNGIGWGRCLDPTLFRFALAALVLFVLGGLPAIAQTDEIQVYNAEIAAPGMFNLTLHDNYTPDGRTVPAFPGGLVPKPHAERRARMGVWRDRLVRGRSLHAALFHLEQRRRCVERI